MDQFVEWMNRAVKLMEAAGVDPVSRWVSVVAVAVAQYGWTLDEASQNLANLLESLSDEPTR
jgi:hypothetical protein